MLTTLLLDALERAGQRDLYFPITGGSWKNLGMTNNQPTPDNTPLPVVNLPSYDPETVAILKRIVATGKSEPVLIIKGRDS
jgi:hypothetical protein